MCDAQELRADLLTVLEMHLDHTIVSILKMLELTAGFNVNNGTSGLANITLQCPSNDSNFRNNKKK